MPIYQFSRSLYRVLGPMITTGDRSDAEQLRQRLLDACETTMTRLEREPDFANPTRFLFDQVRTCFSIGSQANVRRVIELHMALARQALALQVPEHRPCSAFTRQGTACRREAVKGGHFCPSHRHLDRIDALSPPELAVAGPQSNATRATVRSA